MSTPATPHRLPHPADLSALARPRIGLMAAAGTVAGALVAQSGGIGTPEPGVLALAAAGAFWLSAGCSALNQVQERKADARMARTRHRPLARGAGEGGDGALSPLTGVLIALAWLTLAAGLLAATPGGARAALFAPLVCLVYNGLYTPLKPRTPLALLVGALAGALPPMLGFAAAGAHALDARALLLCGVFYAWQAPHFWLFARLHKEDYARAGFCSPPDMAALGPGGFALWLVCYGAAMLLIPAFGLVGAPALKALVAALGGLLCLSAWPLARRGERLGFALVNASLAVFLCLLAADALRLAA